MHILNASNRLPDKAKERFYKIEIPPKDGPLRGYALAEDYFGIWTHWDPPTRICHGHKDCPRCKSMVARRWKGFLPICYEDLKTLRILELTPRTAAVIDRFHEQGLSLLGRHLEVSRLITKGAQRPHVLQINQGVASASDLPRPFDVARSVLHALGEDPDRWMVNDGEHGEHLGE